MPTLMSIPFIETLPKQSRGKECLLHYKKLKQVFTMKQNTKGNMRGTMKGHLWWSLVFGLVFVDNQDFGVRKFLSSQKIMNNMFKGHWEVFSLLSFGIFIFK